MRSTPHRVLIVGGGASGVIVAIALARAGIDPGLIDIADPRERLAEGLAYQSREPHHRLNVPSSKMSAIEAIPGDFAEWAGVTPYSFMDRQSYGRYLRSRLPTEIRHIRDTVTNLDPVPDGRLPDGCVPDGNVLVTFFRQPQKMYSAIVLAMGHGEARIPDFLTNVTPSPRIIRDVWNGATLPESQSLICFGTGLSFIDVAMTHLSRDLKNTVIAISGSGHLPERHMQRPIKPFAPTAEEVATLVKLRQYLAAAGDHWREAIDGLRPVTEAMWRGFTTAEKEEFLRTDGSAWSRRRHRIAPEVADYVDSVIADGRLQVITGAVAEVIVTEKEISLLLEDARAFSGDYLAICIGRDYATSDPLSINLLRDSKTNRGPLGMGLSVDGTTGLLLNTNSAPHNRIYAIGPLRSGEAFESTAIPEIRAQASTIAEHVRHNLLVQ